MPIIPLGATHPSFTHHRAAINGTELHYVSAGTTGTPILLVHGFPETWWTFHKLMPLLARRHRVYAVDLRGFGDSATAAGPCDSSTMAEDLHELIRHLDVGPVHLAGQDIAGASIFRLAATHPAAIASLIAVEMGLAGFGLEALADITRGGAWHIGLLAAPTIPDLLLAGREYDFIRTLFAAMCATPDAVSAADIAEFARTYARPAGWQGAAGLYQSMLREGPDLRALAATRPLAMPVLAIGAGGGPFTAATLSQVARAVTTAQLDGVGHYAALEAPDRLAASIETFLAGIAV